MARRRSGGKHRAHRPRVWWRALVLTFAVGCALAAATLAIVADDPRLLRTAILGALLAAFVPTLLPTMEQRPSPVVDDEFRRLRLEVAALRGELDALRATGSLLIPHQSDSLQLPLVRAALQVPSPSTNGHGHTIDLIEAAARAD